MAAATYAERYQLLYHPTQNIEGTEFFGRVVVALMKAAIDVLNEATGLAGATVIWIDSSSVAPVRRRWLASRLPP